MKSHRIAVGWARAVLLITLLVSTASAQTLRIVSYNIDADTGGADFAMGGQYSGPGLTDVLQAIGTAQMNGHAQPIDVLTLQELHYNNPGVSSTLPFIVGQLNAIYGAGTYAYDTVVGLTNGDFTGNGPNGLIYNTHTVVDLGATNVGSASGSGAPRAPMRYMLKPVGGSAYTQFYVYVSHMKASSGSSNADRRNVEATSLRTNAAALGADAHVIYTGDFNFTSDSSEQAYQTMIASSPSAGQAIDSLNPSNNWTTTSSAPSFWPLLTESATSLTARFDFQLITDPVQKLPGLQLVPGTLGAFGNNGSAGYGHSVTNASNNALTGLPNRAAILNDLITATDHLPVVADYTIVPPGDLSRDGHVNAADISAMLAALANIPGYEAAKGLNDHQTTLIGDVNGDGKFNNTDLQSLVNFLKTGHGTLDAVPEPASIVLIALALPALGWVRCRRPRLDPTPSPHSPAAS